MVFGHLLDRACHPDVGSSGAPADPVLGHEPRRRGQIAVAGIDPSSFDVGESPEALGFELFQRAMKLDELFLDAGVGQLREHVGSQLIDDRPELAHDPSRSNIRSLP